MGGTPGAQRVVFESQVLGAKIFNGVPIKGLGGRKTSSQEICLTR